MKRKILCIALLLAALLLGGCEQAPADTQPSTPAAGQGIMAPDFTVYDENGNPARLSDFFGKPIVLNFWASWCGPCKAEMPEFNQKYLELQGEVQFLMVNLTGGTETVERAADFIRQQGYEFPVYFDVSQEAAVQYQISSIPATYFINAEGKLVTHQIGMLTAPRLESLIGLICGG